MKLSTRLTVLLVVLTTAVAALVGFYAVHTSSRASYASLDQTINTVVASGERHPLTALSSALAEVQQNLHFLNTGPLQVPGLIVMTLDCNQNCDDYRRVVVVFNATTQAQAFHDDSLRNKQMQLHPVLKDSSDSIVRKSTYRSDGTVSVPALTTAVFVGSR